MMLKLFIVAAIAALFVELGCRLVFRQGLAATLMDILDMLDPRSAQARRLRKDTSGAGAVRQLIEKRRSTAAEVARRTKLLETAAEVTEEVAHAEEKLEAARAHLREVNDRKPRKLLQLNGLPDRDQVYLETAPNSRARKEVENDEKS